MDAKRQDEGIICCVQDVHCRELIDRLHWAVRLRWGFAVGALLAALLSLSPAAPTNSPTGILFVTGVLLAAANLFYQRLARRSALDCAGTRELRRIFLLQIVGDYLALAAVVYGMGSIETPIMFLVLPNIFLVTLFYTRRQSLAITLAALGMVMAPLALESAAILPTRALFAGKVKAELLADPLVVGGHLLMLTATVLVCWYLVTVITQRLIRNELELEHSYEQLMRLDEAKTRAVVRATHELKAPLAAINSYVYTLRDGYAGPLPDKAREIVARIGRRCERLLSKITDIIRLSNLRSYVYTGGQYSDIELEPALAQFAREAADAGLARGVEVSFRDESPGPLVVRASRQHLHTLFSNLLENAVNYSDEGGTVELTLRRGADGAEVSVRDHGIGIPPEALAQVFEEYYRAQNAAAHYQGGSGLGLPIVREVARLIGARVALASEPGAGTVATVHFPSARGG